METTTLKELRRVRGNMDVNGVVDITTEDAPEPVTCIKKSYGVYGMNGAMLRGDKTGKIYIIVGRTSNLFRYS